VFFTPAPSLMYSTCLFCHSDLGTNEVIEAFPVGRRLAFDGIKGRLWAVCRRCGRWNLSALDERWDALEQCERLFRSTSLRASTGNVGLARLAEGTDLVRIGDPQRPEMAAWRYGSNFARRHRRHLVQSAVGMAVTISLVATGAYSALAAAIPGGVVLLNFPLWILDHRKRRAVIARPELKSGRKVVIRSSHLPSARLTVVTDSDAQDGWSLLVKHDDGAVELKGAEALRVASKLLARINKVGAGARTVQRAVQRMEHEGGSSNLFAKIAAKSEAEPSGWVLWFSGAAPLTSGDPPGTLRSLVVADRLALEMATHEESERRAMEGELSALEAAWREAEEIAFIADSLVLPHGVAEFLRLHQKDPRDTRIS
jgi:hypothetical protein